MGQELNQHCIFQMHASTLKPRLEPRSVGTPCAFGGHACQHQNPKESGKHNARQLHLALKSGSHELHRAPPAIVMDESNENPASHPPRLRNQTAITIQNSPNSNFYLPEHCCPLCPEV